MSELAPVQRILGILLMLFSLTMLPPVAIAWATDGRAVAAFTVSGLVIAGLGALLWLPVARSRRSLRLRHGFLVVALFWTVLGAVGAVPLMLAQAPGLSLADAVFESVSGLTTTGATMIVGLDQLPRAILFYRQQLQWLGGMGIIVLAVAVLPMLGIGGMQLYRAETPGPVKDTKLTPRITETAKMLWLVYVGLTIVCTLSFWVGGMGAFDAVAHAFSTVATGGFSTHDASFGWFQSPTLEMVAVVFIILGGANFGLHFVALRRQSLLPYVRDAEFRTYIVALVALTAVTVGYLWLSGHFSGAVAFHKGLFQVVSITTSTGFVSAPFADWPRFLPVLLIFANFAGGCASSTAGGLKMIRVLLLFKQGYRGLRQLIHPRAVLAVRAGGQTLPQSVVDGVWGFFAAYVGCFGIGMLILMASGHDQATSFSAMAACLNNMGPGLGDVAANYRAMEGVGEWVLTGAMLLGRLEVFTLLVLLTPEFWRR